MRLSAEVEQRLSDLLLDELRVGETIVTGVVARITRQIQAEWRTQIGAAKLPRKLANAVRSDVYPAGRVSLNAAGLVYSKTPKIIDAFEKGVVIRRERGFFLAIALPAAGKGPGGRKITPGEWEQRTGRQLRFVYRPGRSALLVDDGSVKARARVMGRDGFSRAVRGFSNRTVPIFTLVPQVRLAKRLNLMTSAHRIASSMATSVASEWK